MIHLEMDLKANTVFSVLVDSVFFDTGKSDVFFKNARKLGIELPEDVVIGHGHYDHAGGFCIFQ